MSWMRRILRGVRQRWWRTRDSVERRCRPPRERPVVLASGSRWFVSLFASRSTGRHGRARPAVAIVGPGSTEPDAHGVPMVGFRSGVEPRLDDRAFVDPFSANPTTRDRRSASPADFAALASAARRSVDVQRPTRRRPGSTSSWLAATAAAHEPYRRAHGRTTSDVVAEALRLSGLSDPSEDSIAVVCASRRPHQLDNVVANFRRQRYRPARLVLVLNSDAFDEATVEARIGEIDGATVISIDEDRSLGACLNAAMDLVDDRYVAKFDDDDRYGAEFLGDLMIAHGFARAGVVGKHSHYAHFDTDGRTFLRFPGREFEYTSWVAGGTLLIDRSRTGPMRFRDLSIGEDGAFLADCQRAGHAVFAADRFNYVQHRGDDNTWRRARSQYLRHSVEIAAPSHLEEVER